MLAYRSSPRYSDEQIRRCRSVANESVANEKLGPEIDGHTGRVWPKPAE